MNEKVVNAALLGLGTVGTGVYKVIKSQEQEMTAKLGCQVKITKILVRNLEKASGKVDDPSVLTTDWADIEGDPSIDIVIELIGGIEPARTYILAALKAGKNVVTANKDLIAVHGKEILETARAAQKDFLFEAAVAGGIPIISPLKNSLEANHVTEVMGIVNGIRSCIGAVGDAVSSVANKIRSFLHFSVPDEGPLTDYESWMPDFMGGLAKGIEKSKGMVAKAIEGVSQDMIISPNVSGMESAAGVQTSGQPDSGISSMLSAITSAVKDMKGDPGDIVIPVYLGGTMLDEVIVTAQQRANLRSGGR